MKKLLLYLPLTLLAIKGLAQNEFPNIDPKWDAYYNQHPSGIEDHHQATDFIRIIDFVDFIPNNGMFKKDVNLLKKRLLKLEQEDLNQLQITGSYHSRTYKHDDYFTLYNLTYKKNSKEVWDKYCPYLIPLMDLDETIKLR